ncbi:MAG TPA: ribosome-associated translation inhibitor RaiA [Blastocatellia bacterium]|jgi:putative sigma-54 modulation protein|nr:ribosome-associated translation inhibitor RaiA [Blastocatellia bacterium]
MRFEFTGRHTEITPAVERFAKKELQKLDRVLDSAPMHAHVTITAEKYRKKAEIIIYWRDNVFTGAAENSDLNQSIAAAAAKVEKQVYKLKEKFQTRKRGRVPVREASAATDDGAGETGADAPRIIAARRYRVKPMTAEEAAIIVADLPDQFIVFRDSETNKVGVLYKRKDGNFGLIEP